jgi:DNA-binding winged helix-turn-helix (wHTH) protein/tetratricopeptide (TPR) repeat protein
MVHPPDSSPDVVRFGIFEADLRSGELRKGGVRIRLQEQPLRVLMRLIRQPGEVVTREELRQELWPDNTFLDFEHGLNAAVKRLRDALGDSAESPRFIETLPRRGYRFIAQIQRSGTVADAVAPAKPTVARTWVIVAAILATLGAAAAGVIWWPSAAPPENPEPQVRTAARASSSAEMAETVTVAVESFENRTGDPSLDPLAGQTTGRVVRAVAQVPGVEVETMSPASQAALVVRGALFLHRDGLEVQARIHDGASGRLLHALSPFAAPRTNPGPAIDGLERHVAGAVAVHMDEFFGGLEFVSRPPTIDGYREYRAGLEVFRWDYQRSVAHLQRSLAIDPQFWLSRVVLMFAYDNTGQHDRALEQRSELERERSRLGPAERLFIDYLLESAAGRSVEALRVLADLEARMPQSLLVNFNLVQQLLLANRPRAAVEAYERLPANVRVLRHSVGTWRLDLVNQALHMLGEYERELEESRRGQQHAPGMLFFITSEARALAALGRLAELHATVERSLAIPATAGSAGNVLEVAALELRAHEHRVESLEMASRAVAWRQARPKDVPDTRAHRAALGRALYLAERWDQAEELFDGLANETPGEPEYIGWSGLCAAARGNQARARAASRVLQDLSDPMLHGYHTLWRANLAAALGEREPAVDLLREAMAQGGVYGLHIHNTPALKSLRDYPPFEELVRPKG